MKEPLPIALLRDYQRLLNEGKPAPPADMILRMLLGALEPKIRVDDK